MKDRKNTNGRRIRRINEGRSTSGKEQSARTSDTQKKKKKQLHKKTNAANKLTILRRRRRRRISNKGAGTCGIGSTYNIADQANMKSKTQKEGCTPKRKRTEIRKRRTKCEEEEYEGQTTATPVHSQQTEININGST